MSDHLLVSPNHRRSSTPGFDDTTGSAVTNNMLDVATAASALLAIMFRSPSLARVSVIAGACRIATAVTDRSPPRVRAALERAFIAMRMREGSPGLPPVRTLRQTLPSARRTQSGDEHRH